LEFLELAGKLNVSGELIQTDINRNCYYNFGIDIKIIKKGIKTHEDSKKDWWKDLSHT